MDLSTNVFQDNLPKKLFLAKIFARQFTPASLYDVETGEFFYTDDQKAFNAFCMGHATYEEIAKRMPAELKASGDTNEKQHTTASHDGGETTEAIGNGSVPHLEESARNSSGPSESSLDAKVENLIVALNWTDKQTHEKAVGTLLINLASRLSPPQ